MMLPLLGAVLLSGAADSKEKFQRAVEADIAIAEAAEIAQAKPNEARKLYKYAIELSPDDGDAHLAAARFEQSQKRPELAIRYLDRAVQVAPRHPQAAYERALVLRELKRDDEARAALQGLRESAPQDARPAYWLGLYALQAGESASAYALFDEARKGDGETAALARSYHAILAADRGEKDAPNYAAGALKTAPTEPLRQKLMLLARGATIDVPELPGVRYLPWFNVRADISSEYDTNASIGAVNALQVNANAPSELLPVPVAGFRLTEFLRFVFRPVASEKITLEADASFVNANHLNERATLARYDFGGPQAAARFYSRFGSGLKIEFGLDATYRDLWTEAYRTHFMTAFGVSPNVGLVFAPRHALYAVGTLELRDFVSGAISPISSEADPGRSRNDRDAYAFSGGLFYNVPYKWFDFSASGAYDQENAGRKLNALYTDANADEARGGNYFLRGGRGALSARFNWKNMLLANVYGSLNFRSFPYAVPIRDERRYEVGAALRYFPIRYFGVGVSYSYTHNDASQTVANPAGGAPLVGPYDLYTYRRHVIGLTLTAQY